MAATKEQERKALEKIRKIVDELGEDSYLATAFDGCFDDAETNIENDWGCSFKDRYESTQKKLTDAESHIAELNRQLTEYKQKRKELEARTLDNDSLDTMLAILYQNRSEQEERKKEFAGKIVELAENPNSDEFRRAVSGNRNAQRCIDRINKLAEAVKSAQN